MLSISSVLHGLSSILFAENWESIQLELILLPMAILTFKSHLISCPDNGFMQISNVGFKEKPKSHTGVG